MEGKQREKLKYKCRDLRRNGYALNQIVKAVSLPKTTVYEYIKDVVLTAQQKDAIDKRKRLLRRSRPNPRKGKCIAGRAIRRPSSYWSLDLIHIVAHFMFDGHVREDGCTYYNRSENQIEHLKELVNQIFRIKPILHTRPDGVIVIAFHNVELAAYIKGIINEIFPYLKTKATKEEKRTFLKAFFDDEGNIYYNRNDKRRVRGYQESREILGKVVHLLEEFGIKARIDMHSKAVEISGRENLISFAREIDFSPLICINPNRKNSIWQEEIEKREILKTAISSYTI